MLTARLTRTGSPVRRSRGTLSGPRRAVSVVKKRTSNHEDTIREYKIDSRGLTLGQPLTNFHGVLRGVPTLVGDTTTLL